MINENALRSYLSRQFPHARRCSIRKLGSGVQGSGFLIEAEMPEGVASYVVKTLNAEGLGHDYPADRASVFLLDLDEYGNLPRHVKAIDVLAELEDGSVKSVGGGREYYLLMERAEGRDYFADLHALSGKERLDASDREKVGAMARYLAEIHAVRKSSRSLYWRKLRDTIGHGECLMGVFDLYPDGTLSYEEMAAIEKRCIDWRVRLKPKVYRLAQIHGDFHPGNIWFKEDSSGSGGSAGDFILLDRSRGPWGDPADDVTALTINYIFFSIKYHDEVRGPYYEALQLFFDEYAGLSGDEELYAVLAPFYAFRGAVVANPVFYPELKPGQRAMIFRFVERVLAEESFDYTKVNEYIKE
ncbi:MAG: phosphotransferase [Nitrospirota bacterium]